MSILPVLSQRVTQAFAASGLPADSPALVVPSARPHFGDYQANGVMGVAKRLKTNPRELAAKVVKALDLTDMAQRVEVAGPGFINIHLRDDWIGGRLSATFADERLGVDVDADTQTIVADYSGPNLAKEMHVGHLRSTIIGDAVARVLEFLGHNVVRQNHVGDWGTQFGMLIAYLVKSDLQGQDIVTELADLEEFYRRAKGLFDQDATFADSARAYVVKLQGGDPECLALWRQFIDESMRHCSHVYRRLGVTLTEQHVRAESAYNEALPEVVDVLRDKGLLRGSDGAQCVFLDQFKNREGNPLATIVQKSDGGFLYATTDLAALRHRGTALNAQRVLYFVDARQALHFKQVFAIARLAGFVGDRCSLEHCEFGSMLGPDGKPFKTRSGGTVKLVALLDEAEKRAFELVSEKNADLSEERRRLIGRAVGIGAIKYADLSKHRASDYVFNWEQMLVLEGNTAPYLQYAYTRARSIFRKCGMDRFTDGNIVVTEPSERLLGLKLLQFSEALSSVARDCTPHILCNYLYDIAGTFMGFYEACPVIKAKAEVRDSRLRLCQLSADTLRLGLDLLGIETMEQM